MNNSLFLLCINGAPTRTRTADLLITNLWTTAFAPTKASQRILAQSLAKQLGPSGIHVAYLVIDGVIDTADTRENFAPSEPDEFFMKPDRIAEMALMLVNQDPSSWTFELEGLSPWLRHHNLWSRGLDSRYLFL